MCKFIKSTAVIYTDNSQYHHPINNSANLSPNFNFQTYDSSQYRYYEAHPDYCVSEEQNFNLLNNSNQNFQNLESLKQVYQLTMNQHLPMLRYDLHQENCVFREYDRVRNLHVQPKRSVSFSTSCPKDRGKSVGSNCVAERHLGGTKVAPTGNFRKFKNTVINALTSFKVNHSYKKFKSDRKKLVKSFTSLNDHIVPAHLSYADQNQLNRRKRSGADGESSGSDTDDDGDQDAEELDLNILENHYNDDDLDDLDDDGGDDDDNDENELNNMMMEDVIQEQIEIEEADQQRLMDVNKADCYAEMDDYDMYGDFGYQDFEESDSIEEYGSECEKEVKEMETDPEFDNEMVSVVDF